MRFEKLEKRHRDGWRNSQRDASVTTLQEPHETASLPAKIANEFSLRYTSKTIKKAVVTANSQFLGFKFEVFWS